MSGNPETITLHPAPGHEQHDILPTWRHLTTTHACFASTSEHCPDRAYVAQEIPGDEPGKRICVRKVVFTTTSRDQGFASERPELTGTYSDANAFFEVSVIDSNGQDRINREVLHHVLRGTPRFVEHVVCWDHRDESLYDTEMRKTGDVDDHRLGMMPSKWLEPIRGGDSIQIVPRADHPAWINYTLTASIDIWVEALDIDPARETRFSQDAYKLYRPLQVGRKEIRLVIIAPRNMSPQRAVSFCSVYRLE
jgi:hypothetical protein